MLKEKTIYIASDHGGFQLKAALVKWLESENFTINDLGPDGLNLTDDYPDFAFPVAKAVAADKGALGILLCRSGQGVCIVANKVSGIQAGVALNPEMARAGRQDDQVNVLCLAADQTSFWDAQKIVKTWLETEPGTDDRFVRRIQKIRAIEDNERSFS